MGFWNYFYIVVFVLLILFVVYELILLVVNSQRIKKINRKVAVKKSIWLDIYWIVLSVINALLDYDRYKTVVGINDKSAKLNFLAFISWTICGTAHILMIFLDKYIYITPDGVFYKSMIKIQRKEKYRYRIDGDTLELYYKQNDKPAKYKIVGDKEELIKILDENYEKYTRGLNSD
ncbi:MAG: hypothetical protein K2K91_12015 [Ruminococcus sp.]|nr:hypothetical protein [Ruminococcus sp.]MDE7098470.1 hypothetical protein [Ruminococcus sp.]